MNAATFLAEFRRKNPNSPYSDEEALYQIAMDAQDAGVLDQYPDLKQVIQTAQLDAEGGWGGLPAEAGRTLLSGVDQVQAKLYDTAALAGRVTGIDRLHDWGADGRERNLDEASVNAPLVTSLDEVNTPMEFAYWLTGMVNSQAPQIIGTLGAAAGAIATAPASVPAGLAGAVGAGIFGFTQAQNFGELEELGGENTEALAIANGLIGSALESVVPVGRAKALLGGLDDDVLKGLARSVISQAPAGVVRPALVAAREGSKEMLTELAQEAVSIATEVASNRNNPDFHLDDAQIRSRLINAGAAGMVLGGGLGASTEIVRQRLGPRVQTSPFARTAPIAQPAQTRASLDPVIPPIRPLAPSTTPSVAANPVPPAGTPAVPPPSPAPSGPAPVTPETQQALIAAGVSPDVAVTLTEVEALQMLQAQPQPVTPPPPAAPAVPAGPTQEQLIAQARAEQARFEQEARQAEYLQRVQAQADAEAEQMAAQADREIQRRAREARNRAAQARAEITPFRIPQQPTDPKPLAPVTPFEVRQAAQLTELPNNILPLEGETAPAPEGEATVERMPMSNVPLRALPSPEAGQPDNVVPFSPSPTVGQPAAPAQVTPGPAPTQVGSTPVLSQPTQERGFGDFLKQHVLVDQYLKSNAADVVTAKMAVSGSKIDGSGVRTTRNAAVVIDPQGRVSLVPVFEKKPGDVYFLARPKIKIDDVAKRIAAEMDLDTGLVKRALYKGQLSERSDAKAFRNDRIRRRAAELGWAPRTEKPVDLKVDEALRKTGAQIFGYLHFQNPLPGGEVRFVGSVDDFLAQINAAKGPEYREGITRAAAPVVGSIDAPTSTGGSFANVIADPNAQIPGRTPAAPRARPALLSPAATITPAEQANKVQFSDALIGELAAELKEPRVRELLQMERGPMIRAVRDVFNRLVSRLESVDIRNTYAEIAKNADAEHLVLKSALADALAQIEYAKEFGGSTLTYRRNSSEDYVVSKPKIRELHRRLIQTAGALGIDLRITNVNGSSAARFLRNEGGATSVDPTNRTVVLVMKSVLRPSEQDVFAALHEILHDVVNQQPEWKQRLLHEAIERVRVEDLAFYGSKKADVRLQQDPGSKPLTERLVEHATFKGMEQAEATGFIDMVLRLFRDWALNAAIHLQKLFLGEANVSGRLAKEWVENAAARLAAGDVARITGFLDAFGVKASYGSIARYVTNDDGRVTRQRIDPRTGEVSYPITTEISPASARYAVESVVAALKEQLHMDGTIDKHVAEQELADMLGEADQTVRPVDLRTAVDDRKRKLISQTRSRVAVANQLLRVYRRLFERVQQEFPDYTPEEKAVLRAEGIVAADTLTFENFMRSLGRGMDVETAKVTELTTLSTQLDKEFGEKVDWEKNPAFKPEILIDDLPANERGLAEYTLVREINRHFGKVAQRTVSTRELSARLDAKAERRRAEIVAIDKNLAEYKVTDRIARQQIRSYLRSLGRDLKHLSDTSEALGGIDAVISQLEEGVERQQLQDKYTERLLDTIAVDEIPLGSALKALFDLENEGLDLGTATPAQVREKVTEQVALNSDSPLAMFVDFGDGPQSRVRATALFGAVLTFVKQQAHIAEVMRAQLGGTDQDRDALLQLREVLNETSESRLREIEAELKNNPQRSARMIQQWLNRRDENIKAERTASNLDRMNGYLSTVARTLTDMQARAQSRLGVHVSAVLADGAKIPVPPSADASSEMVQSSLRSLDLGRETFLRSDEMRQILKAQSDWLEHRITRPELQDATFFTVQALHERLLQVAFLSDDRYKTLGGLRSGYHEGMSVMLNRTGTRAGRIASNMWTRYDQLLRSWAATDQVQGKKYERAAENFYKVAGLDATAAKDALRRPALFFLGSNPDLTEDEAFVALERYLRTDQSLDRVLSRPGAWDAFVTWMKADKAANQYVIRNSLKAGNRVSDDDLTLQNFLTGREGAAFRLPVERGVTGYTIPQKVHREIVALMKTLSDRFRWLGDGKDSPFEDVGLKLQLRKDELRAQLAEFVTPEVHDNLLTPLILNAHRPTLPAPARADRLKLQVPVEIARAAWGRAKGDLIVFAELVHAEMSLRGGVEQDVSAYTKSVLDWVGGTLRRLNEQVNPRPSSTGVSINGVVHVAMDARVADNFPQEWLDYHSFTADDLRGTSHLIAANAAFGRDFRDLYALYARVQTELEGMAKQLPPEAEARQALKRQDLKKFAELLAAEEALNTGSSETLVELTQNIFQPDAVGMKELGWVAELYGLVITGMLTGLKSAVKNVISMADTLALERSLSLKSLQTPARAAGAFMQEFFAAALGVFGVDLMKNSRYNRALADAGVFDASAQLTLADHFRGGRGRDNNLDRTRGGRAARRIRQFRNFITNQRLGFSKGLSTVPLRAFNWFQYTQQLSNMAVTKALMKRFEEIALLGADFYQKNPDRKGTPFTAQEIGYADAVGFENLRAEALEHGIIFERLAERGQSADVVDEDLALKTYNLTLTRVTGESSANNRPVWTQTSKFARVNTMLVGWSLFKSGTVYRMLQTPQGQRDFKTMLRGLTTLGLGMVPIGIAFSLLLDEYDEEVTGKKSNLRPLTADDLHRSLIERMVAVGSLGIAGDAIDVAFNIRDGAAGNSLSIDQRIVWVNSVIGLAKTFSDLQAMGGNANYANFYRRLMQPMGLGGMLQNMQVANRLLDIAGVEVENLPVIGGLAGAEAEVVSRINVNNWLRAAGRQLGMEVRTFGGGSTPNQVTPYLTNMVLAALQDDAAGFQKAYQQAVRASAEMGKPDPETYVRSGFASRHPLKQIFRVTPNVDEVQALLSIMDENGRRAVQSGIDLVNHYGRGLGVKPYYGADTRMRSRDFNPSSVADLRRLTASQRMGSEDLY